MNAPTYTCRLQHAKPDFNGSVVFCMHNIFRTMSSRNIVHALMLDNRVEQVAAPCHGQLHPILSAWYSVPPVPSQAQLQMSCPLL